MVSVLCHATSMQGLSPTKTVAVNLVAEPRGSPRSRTNMTVAAELDTQSGVGGSALTALCAWRKTLVASSMRFDRRRRRNLAIMRPAHLLRKQAHVTQYCVPVLMVERPPSGIDKPPFKVQPCLHQSTVKYVPDPQVQGGHVFARRALQVIAHF
eukprot:TRINITY_DN2104_c0_g3_i1.p2 TRINITY_DN2104_c0_g3~~TRINITY_DN2104_c0_g3_i1.p2  ORF type:complete len:154 (+),score=8.74 TRINITY_DN2104_c0_g3_i1:825-1286(+)